MLHSASIFVSLSLFLHLTLYASYPHPHIVIELNMTADELSILKFPKQKTSMCGAMPTQRSMDVCVHLISGRTPRPSPGDIVFQVFS